jgi:hypothetical protein
MRGPRRLRGRTGFLQALTYRGLTEGSRHHDPVGLTFNPGGQAMGGIAWAETLTEAKTRAADDERLLLTYLFAPG